MGRHFGKTVALCVCVLLIICIGWGFEYARISGVLGLGLDGLSIGDWGDSFSALNAVFSGAALIGLGATIYLQLQFAQRQIADNGKAEFERVFFQLLKLIRELRSDLVFTERSSGLRSEYSREIDRIYPKVSGSYGVGPDTKPKISTGTDAIYSAFRVVTNKIDKRLVAGDQISEKQLAQIYNVTVNRYHEAEFGPYFRSIYSLLKRIDSSRYLSETEKLDYSRLLRSQMTSHEAILLGLNSIAPHSKDLKHYVESYRMLKYSASGRIREELSRHFGSEVFKGR